MITVATGCGSIFTTTTPGSKVDSMVALGWPGSTDTFDKDDRC
jgi:hypothetical protein